MIIIAYGTAIADALSRPETTIEELIALREHAHSILQAQGDLPGALKKLEEEIRARQQGGAGSTP